MYGRGEGDECCVGVRWYVGGGMWEVNGEWGGGVRSKPSSLVLGEPPG